MEYYNYSNKYNNENDTLKYLALFQMTNKLNNDENKWVWAKDRKVHRGYTKWFI